MSRKTRLDAYCDNSCMGQVLQIEDDPARSQQSCLEGTASRFERLMAAPRRLHRRLQYGGVRQGFVWERIPLKQGIPELARTTTDGERSSSYLAAVEPSAPRFVDRVALQTFGVTNCCHDGGPSDADKCQCYPA